MGFLGQSDLSGTNPGRQYELLSRVHRSQQIERALRHTISEFVLVNPNQIVDGAPG